MTVQNIKQLPLRLQTAHKSDVRTQFAALCYRVVKDKTQILLVTSRGSGRWIVPKGWPMDGVTPARAAMTEAWEEAGVEGQSIDVCLGMFSYSKMLGPDALLPCVAMVYPVRVRELAADYPESGMRQRKWFSQKKAAKAIQEPELAQIIKSFDPRKLKR
ncbi:MAG: NUDIX hydrolase [Paracoccaceae bacterium]|uniref:NUDIX hydrolase n=1 Tax=unclassified Seohaeicola TaxID=2641111 RepID=UPI00237BF4E3|nr:MULTISPECIES: NUDIX hydrolase [unclassified Seohaeicola]MDD9708186.1 NUDIX hydrolase [Seohaeicola sp. 4SK31]MDD9736150.1 NUDIX hydrolase [Seohaeicola sp. SP36]MDF1710406.1 NUDIX hydrolase [Paracoccaceae bacterium]MDM7969430.1 NUDIX hydrolase [Paracoccaceae bacterium]